VFFSPLLTTYDAIKSINVPELNIAPSIGVKEVTVG
jgi:hypothetical protein